MATLFLAHDGGRIAYDDTGRGPLVRDFLAEFRGLSSTVKRRAVLETIGASRKYLADFFLQARNGAAVFFSRHLFQRRPIVVK